MSKIGKKTISACLEALYFSGVYRLGIPIFSGVGSILTFHHVRPPRPEAFQPNRGLEITPLFLDEVISGLREAGLDIVSLDEAHRRLTEGDFSRRFVALTFDDGYRDIQEHAYPILKRHDAPFTIFVPTSFPDGSGDLWWIVLERAIAASDSIEVEIGGTTRRLQCTTDGGKSEAFAAAYRSGRALADEGELRRTINKVAVAADINTDGICRELCMGWNEIAALAEDPSVTIGAHTHTHIMLAKAPAETVQHDILTGVERINTELGFRPAHLSFPVGDPTSAGPREFRIAKELGFKTAVTTRAGVLFRDHCNHLTALPRISVNGEFQRRRYLDVLLSGVPTALMNRFRRVNAA